MNFKHILLAIPKIFISLFETINAISFAWYIGWALLVEIIKKFVFNDWDFLLFLLVPFVLDTFFGTWASIKDGTFRFERFYELIAKVFVYLGILVLGHALSSFTVAGKVTGYGVVANGFYTILITYESHSALKKMGKVYPKAAFIQFAEQWLYTIIRAKQGKALTTAKDGTGQEHK